MFGCCARLAHCPSENLLDEAVQQAVLSMIRALCFLAAGAAPECCAFFHAVTPPIRSRLHPEGLPTLSGRIMERVQLGSNLHAYFVFQVVTACCKLELKFWTENPDGSFLWLMPFWLTSGLSLMENFYRCDMCHFGALWRKRTRFACNLEIEA